MNHIRIEGVRKITVGKVRHHSDYPQSGNWVTRDLTLECSDGRKFRVELEGLREEHLELPQKPVKPKSLADMSIGESLDYALEGCKKKNVDNPPET